MNTQYKRPIMWRSCVTAVTLLMTGFFILFPGCRERQREEAKAAKITTELVKSDHERSDRDMKKATVLLLALSTSACTHPERSRKALTDSGYSEVAIGGYALVECGEDDSYATKFTANNPAGKRVSGVVCCGLFKGCTN